MTASKTPSSAEITREKLIDAGPMLFAKYGLDGVRTRQLADAAKVNQSAIPYHFGGKAAVYAAVLERIALTLSTQMAPVLSHVHDQLNATASPKDAQNLARILLPQLSQALTLALLSPNQANDRTLLIVHEQLQPSEHYAALYHSFIEPVHTALTRLIALIQARPAPDFDAITMAHALIGQSLGFIVAKQAYLSRTGLSQLDDDHIQHIAQTVSHMALAAIQSPPTARG